MELLSKLTAETILSDEVLCEVFDETDEIHKARLLLSLIDRAAELGVKSKFNALVKAYKKEEKKMDSQSNRGGRLFDGKTDFDYFENGVELNCGNWIANESGIIEYNAFGLMQRACYHPILPVQVLKNAEDGKEKVKLAFKKNGRWQEITVDKGVIASASRIVGLASYGVAVTSENAKYLVRYMSDIENLNAGTIEHRTSTSKFGWLSGEFIPYGSEIEFDSKERFKDLFESVTEHGSKKKWFELLDDIRHSGRKEPQVYIAASFASILLKPLNLLPFIVNLWSETGKGKTVALMVAASIWANPSEGKYLTDPSATSVSLEVRNNILNHLPLMIDDLSKLKDKYGDAFTDMIYMLCGGKGKDRSNRELGLEKPTSWQNVVLTNIERPLATDTMRGGAINRILDFEMEDGYVFEDGNAVVKICTKNYGFAGPMFVRAVEELGIDKVTQIQQEYLERINQYCRENDLQKEEKQILPMSVLLTADRIATDHIFKDGIYLNFEWCVNQLKGKDEVSDTARAYEVLMDEIRIHQNNFQPDINGQYRGEFWGAVRGDYVYIVPSVMESLLTQHSFSVKAFLQWAYKNDLLSCDNDKSKPGRKTKKARIPATDKPKSFYCIKISSEDEPEEEFMEVSEQEMMDLPFNI